MPPSIVLKEFFDKGSNREGAAEAAAKKVLLSVEETKFWFTHLQTVVDNRKRGAAKAALTRQRKKQEKMSQSKSDSDGDNEQCGSCKQIYSKSDSQFWIFCDHCQVWFCSTCEGLFSEPESITYCCSKCSA